MLARKKSRVYFFHHGHARIVSDFPSQLTTADVHREYFGRASLQQTIGKSSGRCANVERGVALNVDAEKLEPPVKFQRPATCELRRLQNGNWRTQFNPFARFGEHMLPHPHFARHDRPLCTLAALKKSALDQQI